MNKIEFLPLRTIPEVEPNNDLGEIISHAAQREIGSLKDKDIVIITMKIVSKAEGCLVHLDKVSPSEKAQHIAKETGKPVQLTQVILDHCEKIIGLVPFYELAKNGAIDLKRFSQRPEEALEMIKHNATFLITIDKHGAIYCNAGVDMSNHPGDVASYPPPNPDLSAKNIRKSIKNHSGKNTPVIIADTEILFFGTIDMPRGVSGVPLQSKRFGERDLFNNPTFGGSDLIAFALTAAAGLLFGQTNEGVPVVVARGYEYEIVDEVIDRSKNYSSAKKILKAILKSSITSRIAES